MSSAPPANWLRWSPAFRSELIGVAMAYAIVMFGLFVPALVYAGRPVGIGAQGRAASGGAADDCGARYGCASGSSRNRHCLPISPP